MTAIELLLRRMSRPVLAPPGPDDEQLDIMFRAALRAPDHARLRPWRFLVVRGEGREKLGELMAKVALIDKPDLAPEAIARTKGLPLRAPVLILCICHIQEHAKVPPIEQKMSLAAATQNMLLAAHAQKLGAIWRTGALCYHPAMAKGLGLSENEELLGFVYVGTPAGSLKNIQPVDVEDFVSHWP